MPADSSWEERRVKRGTENALYPPVDLNTAIRTGEVTNQFLLVPRPVSSFRDYLPDGNDDDSSGANDGSVSFSDGAYTVSVPGSASGEQQAFESARIGTYRPGSVAVAGLYVRKASTPAGKAEWGYKREGSSDGFYVRYDSDGSLTFVVERGGTETRIPQSDWDSETDKSINDESDTTAGRVVGFDAFDGSGRSGIDLDPADGHIYRFDWSWYGGGTTALNIVGMGPSGRQRAWPAVLFEPEGRPSINQPNQPLFARVDTQSETASDQLVVQGRQYSTLGNFRDAQRRTEHFNSGVTVGTSDAAVISFRRKSGDEGVDMDLIDLNVQTDQALHGYLLVDPDFNTGPSWSMPSGVNNSGETAVEVEDGSDVDTASGDQYGGFVLGSGKNTEELSGVGEREFPIVRQKPVVLVMRSITGSTASVNASLTVGEKW